MSVASASSSPFTGSNVKSELSSAFPSPSSSWATGRAARTSTITIATATRMTRARRMPLSKIPTPGGDDEEPREVELNPDDEPRHEDQNEAQDRDARPNRWIKGHREAEQDCHESGDQEHEAPREISGFRRRVVVQIRIEDREDEPRDAGCPRAVEGRDLDLD